MCLVKRKEDYYSGIAVKPPKIMFHRKLYHTYSPIKWTIAYPCLVKIHINIINNANARVIHFLHTAILALACDMKLKKTIPLTRLLIVIVNMMNLGYHLTAYTIDAYVTERYGLFFILLLLKNKNGNGKSIIEL